MRTWTVPYVFTVSATISLTDSCEATSQVTPWASPPRSAISPTTESTVDFVREATTTCAPASAKALAAARPMPRPAPVTMATEPLRSCVISFPFRKRSVRCLVGLVARWSPHLAVLMFFRNQALGVEAEEMAGGRFHRPRRQHARRRRQLGGPHGLVDDLSRHVVAVGNHPDNLRIEIGEGLGDCRIVAVQHLLPHDRLREHRVPVHAVVGVEIGQG